MHLWIDYKVTRIDVLCMCTLLSLDYNFIRQIIVLSYIIGKETSCSQIGRVGARILAQIFWSRFCLLHCSFLSETSNSPLPATAWCN